MLITKKSILNLLLLVVAFISTSCATMVLVDSAGKTYTERYTPSKGSEKIQAFSKGNEIVIQYIGNRNKNKNISDSNSLVIEAVYKIDSTVSVTLNNKEISIIAPSEYKTHHRELSTDESWDIIPINYIFQEKLDSKSKIYDVASGLDLKSYKTHLDNSKNEKKQYNTTIENISDDTTSISISILPTLPLHNNHKTNKNSYRRRAIFMDNRFGNNKKYIMMMPAYGITKGHYNKAKLILLPLTLSFDIITSPVQIPLLKGISKIGQ